MKKLIVSIVLSLSLLTISRSSLLAISDHVEIADLPTYTKSDNFAISYSAFSESSVSVKFYFKKDGGSYEPFGPTFTTPSGKVDVTGTQVSEQTKYFFKVELNGATMDETSVIYDISGPSAVNDYNKETLSPTHVKLTWRNPNDSDFWKVIIYRSTSSEFTADDNTKVAEIVGPRDGVMSWEDAGQEAGKTYYYAIRAVDVAGNGSSLVSDQGASVLGASTTTTSTTEGTVTLLPDDGVGGGQVLGDEEEENSEEASNGSEEVQEINLGQDAETAGSSSLRRVLISIAAGLLLLTAYRFFFKKEK